MCCSVDLVYHGLEVLNKKVTVLILIYNIYCFTYQTLEICHDRATRNLKLEMVSTENLHHHSVANYKWMVSFSVAEIKWLVSFSETKICNTICDISKSSCLSWVISSLYTWHLPVIWIYVLDICYIYMTFAYYINKCFWISISSILLKILFF